MTTKERKAIHLQNLRAIGFTGTLEQIYRLEAAAHRKMELACTYADFDMDKAKASITKSATKLFGGKLPAGFFVNGDPRGYTLKIRDDSAKNLNIYKDWGGYGILAPEIKE